MKTVSDQDRLYYKTNEIFNDYNYELNFLSENRQLRLHNTFEGVLWKKFLRKLFGNKPPQTGDSQLATQVVLNNIIQKPSNSFL